MQREKMIEVDGIPTERIASVVWLIASGVALTSNEIAERTGLTWWGANRMLNKISRVLPIYKDDQGCWRSLHR